MSAAEARLAGGFVRQHARPLLGSLLLHALVFGVVAFAAWFSVVPRVTPPATIEAYIAQRPAPRTAGPPAQVAVPATPAAPAAEPASEPPVVARRQDDTAARDAAAATAREAGEQRARERAAAEARRTAETAFRERETAEARRQAASREQAALARRAADEKRKAAVTAEAQRRTRVEEELKVQLQREQATRQDTAQRTAREADLARQLGAEEHRLGAENAGLLGRYVAELKARIERAWNRPPTARSGLRCIVNVTQVPGGTVTDVHVGDCNGDAAVRQSIVLAVFRASPLPAPPDPSLFERNLTLVFAPDA